MTAKLFVDFVLRHTLPSRARANGPEVTHDLIKNHPFVTEAPAEGAGERVWDKTSRQCPSCFGRGRIFKNGVRPYDCPGCAGSGKLPELRARSSAPEAREGEAVRILELIADGWDVIESSGSMGEMTLQAPDDWDGDETEIVFKFHTHPATPSSDKLRTVVEGFVSDLTGGHPLARSSRLVISHDALSKRIDQAIAALKAEG